MRNLLNKEIMLTANILSYLFVLFGFMAVIPGYPILLGAFFVCFGIFNTFQSARENNDILYTVLLPVKKTDVVKAKFAFTVFIQIISFSLFLALTILRMTVFSETDVYVENVMMNANQVFLGYILIVFTLFNCIFISGYFKTAYKFGKPFLLFVIYSFLFICITETLHHIPGLEFLNKTNTISDAQMWIIFICCVLIYVMGTFFACKLSMRAFEKVDM